MTHSINRSKHRKQQGALSVEAMMVIGGVLVALMFIMTKIPVIMYKINVSKFTSQAAEIVQETQGRPNLSTLTIPKLCERNALSDTICGEAKNGIGTNPFGGNWELKGNTSSPALIDITATLPNDTDHLLDLADLMAPTTRAGCIEADGCSTIKTTSSSIVMTY
ncbi:hypothetical protein GNP84_06630 [Aliivibrio fischeri]|uniref:hypothetical protein n=1 Tax=Aliivibrio fischeri TaxID=668 RepID=UPI0012D98CA1|nr:hypothetical protein [Aliivibrio fischeri]MUK76581.1 hypothetical protein [Aliivibrio fischeri]